MLPGIRILAWERCTLDVQFSMMLRTISSIIFSYYATLWARPSRRHGIHIQDLAAKPLSLFLPQLGIIRWHYLSAQHDTASETPEHFDSAISGVFLDEAKVMNEAIVLGTVILAAATAAYVSQDPGRESSYRPRSTVLPYCTRRSSRCRHFDCWRTHWLEKWLAVYLNTELRRRWREGGYRDVVMSRRKETRYVMEGWLFCCIYFYTRLRRPGHWCGLRALARSCGSSGLGSEYAVQQGAIIGDADDRIVMLADAVLNGSFWTIAKVRNDVASIQ